MAKAIKLINNVLTETTEMTKVIALGANGLEEVDITGSANDWTPPADWINIRDVANNEIHLLVGDFVPYIAFDVTVTGGYVVNWGDGSSSENFASGAVATHTYAVGSGQSCSRGYTTYKIRIYAQTPANNITAFHINNQSTAGGSLQYQCNSILWACLGTTGLTALDYAFCDYSTPIQISPYLEAIELPTSLTSCTTFVSLAYNCYSLQYVKMPTSYSSSNIDFGNTFLFCYKLRKINFNVSSLNVSRFSSTFYNNYSLAELTLPATVNNCLDWGNLISGCYSITEFTAPTINTNCNAYGMFQNCFNIRKITFNSSWNGRPTNISNMFQNCYNLEDLTLFSSVSSSVTSFGSLFQNCYRLRSVTIPSGFGTITDVSNIFSGCYLLETVNNFPVLNNATSLSNFANNTYRLKNIANLDLLGNITSNYDLASTHAGMYSIESLSIRNKITGRFALAGVNANLRAKLNSLRFTNTSSTFAGTSPQIDIQYCSLDATALNQVFTDLPTLSGKTIRVTGNPGAATCDTSIATAKGWTVTT